jgi:hypothetical protein
MAKNKTAKTGGASSKKKKSATARARPARTARKKQSAGKKSARGAKSQVKKPKSKANAKTRNTAAANSAAGKSGSRAAPRVGRPKITGDEKLFLLFHENYHARQIFEFLRVETVRELEEFSPDEIIQLLSQPITYTVRQIREKLADKNRYLSGDAGFAVSYKKSRAE